MINLRRSVRAALVLAAMTGAHSMAAQDIAPSHPAAAASNTTGPLPISGGPFPGAAWKDTSPQKAGWSLPTLEEARRLYESLPPANLLVVDHGRVVVQWGDPAQRIKLSSIRKTFLSSLYGIHAAAGDLDLDKTLAQLAVDDEPPLTPVEKQATVRMLLQARSGVYHSYVAGTPAMRETQPPRGSHPPGTFWYYNNWDFNALGSIFEQQLHAKIGVEFRSRIADPLHMQDFREEDVYYLHADEDSPAYAKSLHPAYHFRLSARDLARFGYLYLQQGNWNGTQVVPGGWVAESTRSYSAVGDGEGYGYLWWVNGFDLPVKSFSARGALGKYLLVIPERNMIIVYLNHTEFPDNAPMMSEADLKKLPTPSRAQIDRLLKLLLDAQRPTR